MGGCGSGGHNSKRKLRDVQCARLDVHELAREGKLKLGARGWLFGTIWFEVTGGPDAQQLVLEFPRKSASGEPLDSLQQIIGCYWRKAHFGGRHLMFLCSECHRSARASMLAMPITASGSAPITVSTLCPHVQATLITAKFREPDRPLGPSFNCNTVKAMPPVSFLLCSDQELMHLDALMGELYRMMRQREGGGNTELLAAQRAWIVKRDKKCKISARLFGAQR
jgi:uncharacterized protein YecT (DUF1311 family)